MHVCLADRHSKDAVPVYCTLLGRSAAIYSQQWSRHPRGVGARGRHLRQWRGEPDDELVKVCWWEGVKVAITIEAIDHASGPAVLN